MKKEKRILTAVSLLFAASVVFVFFNALDVKLGLCGGGCPDCICDVCENASPCGDCPCVPACGEGYICDGADCVSSCTVDCGTQYGVCGNSIECGNCAGDETSCECSEGSCVGCTAPDTCIAGNCLPPGCSGIGCFAELLPNTQDSGEDCGEGMFCLECIDDYSWNGDACVTDCVPDTCASLGYNCDTHDDGCEGTIDCGTCTAPDVCSSGVCGCTPNCTGKVCGGNGCGGSCGTCSSSNYCSGSTYYNGKVCSSGSCVDGGDIGCCNHSKCGAGQYCNSSHSCTALSACYERSGGSYGQSSVTAAEGYNCSGADTYCCSGNCVNPPGNPSELGGACGSGDCAGGTWGCSGSDYECSSIGTECDRCSGDKRYDSVCDKDGACDENEHDCDACNTCQMSGTTASCAEAYERIQDTVDPNLCNGAGQVCHDGGCCDLHTCGDGASECGLGLDDNCGGTINCYCDKTDASCECSGGSCHSCAGTDASCWCYNEGSGAGGECENCHSLKVCKVDEAGIEKNECIGRGIVPPSQPSDVPGDFEQSIMNITNWLAGFIVILAILAIVYGGLIYISSSGDQEKASGGKKVVTYALLGLIIAGIAYAAVKVIVDIL